MGVMGVLIWDCIGIDLGLSGGFPKVWVPTIMENQMEKKMEMNWKLVLYRGLWGLGFPKSMCTFWGGGSQEEGL